MAGNVAIVGSAAGITAIGVANAYAQHKPITRIVVGGYLLALFLSLADVLGGGVSQVAGALALLALVTVLLTEGLPLLQALGAVVGAGGAQQGKGGG